MALIHKATLTPSKVELLRAWLPSRAWFTGEGDVRQVGAYRFDDPAGEVGLQAMLLRTADGSVLHTPLAYRGAPLAGAEEYLVGVSEHSVLGRRWVYDGCGDPVWVTALVTTVLTGGTQVEELIDVGGRLEPLPLTATVRGSGAPGTPVSELGTLTCHDDGLTTVVRADDLEVVVARVAGAEVASPHTLTGRWPEGGPAVLAGVRPIQ